MNRQSCVISVLCAVALIVSSTSSFGTLIVPKRLYGNLGFFYTGTESDGGATANSSLTTLSLNLDSYVWRPWFATLNFGAASSMTRSESAVASSKLDLLTTHLNFALIPRSRFPFRLTFNTGNNVSDWTSGKSLISFGPQYRTRYLNARQSIITLKGNRVDGWFTQRTRYFDTNKLTDNTVGAKLKLRGKSHNIYGNSTYQTRKNSVNDNETKNILATATLNYFPTSEFYIKTLTTTVRSDDETETSRIIRYQTEKDVNQPGKNFEDDFFRNRATTTTQVSSFFYWRPDYKPYTVTGGFRAYDRRVDNSDSTSISNIDAGYILANDTEGNKNAGLVAADVTDINSTNALPDDVIQRSISANLAANYKINRRLRFLATGDGFVLHTRTSDSKKTDTQNSNQTALLSYNSDKVIFRQYQYNWNASGGFSNKIDRTFEDIGFNQNYNAGIGHNLTRRWVTGNRSTLRVALSQSAREFIQWQSRDRSLGISHSASINWNEELKKGKFYSQLTALDSRNIDESTESQVINFQFSRIVPVNRLSQWGAHFSAQSSRRYSDKDEGEAFWDGFLTSLNGRLNYQHARMFGIYKLKFRTKLEINSTPNRVRGDRKQADWEGRLGYNIGKLSTALIGRKVWSDSGLGAGVIIFQVNRSF